MNFRYKLERGLTLGVIILAMSFLGGCTSFRGEMPRLNVVNLKIVGATPLEQRYQVRLRVQNPNPKGISLNGLNFDLYLNDRRFISGMSGLKVKVPRYGDVVVDVMASSTVFSLYHQLVAMSKGRGKKLNYKLKGKLSLDGYRPLPFEKSGDLTPQSLVEDKK